MIQQSERAQSSVRFRMNDNNFFIRKVQNKNKESTLGTRELTKIRLHPLLIIGCLSLARCPPDYETDLLIIKDTVTKYLE